MSFPTTHLADYYCILGVPHDATAAELKTAFRKQSLLHHPDKAGMTGDAHENFILIRLAYEILQDPQARAAYDATSFAFKSRAASKRKPRQSTNKRTNQKTRQQSPGSHPHGNADADEEGHSRFDFSKIRIKKCKHSQWASRLEAKSLLKAAGRTLKEIQTGFDELVERYQPYAPRAERKVWEETNRVKRAVATLMARVARLKQEIHGLSTREWNEKPEVLHLVDSIRSAVAKTDAMNKSFLTARKLARAVAESENEERKKSKLRFRLELAKWSR